MFFSFFKENRFNERTPMLANTNHGVTNHGESPIGFLGALKIPGVIEFSLCLFFSKLVNYTFLFWLPLYIKNTSKHNLVMTMLVIFFSNI